MSNCYELIIIDIVGPYCGSRSEGDAVHKELVQHWDEFDTISVDFEGVEITTLSFFNAAFTPFIFDNSVDEVQTKLSFLNIDDKDKSLLNQSFRAAINQLNKDYASNQ